MRCRQCRPILDCSAGLCWKHRLQRLNILSPTGWWVLGWLGCIGWMIYAVAN